MSTATIHEAKTNLSRLLAMVEAGEEIVIVRGKTPVARLIPIHAADKVVASGGREFSDPMTDAELAEWE